MSDDRTKKSMPRLGRLAGAGLVALAAAPVAGQGTEPRFPSDVEVVAVDASVVDSDGRPVRGLTADDFVVEVDGRRRRVLTADFVLRAGPAPATDPAAPAAPVAVAGPAIRPEGRRVILVVDRGELGIGAVNAATRAARGFLDQLGPHDEMALFSLPSGPRVDFTDSRAAIQKALDKMAPAQDRMPWEFDVSITEAVDIVERRPRSGAIVDRECFQFLKMAEYVPTAPENCARRVENEARLQVEAHQRSVEDRLRALEALCTALGTIPGPKTLVLASGGFGSEVAGTSRSVNHLLRRVATAASAARVNLYSLYFSQRAVDFEAANTQASYTPGDDRRFRVAGLEALTGLAGGAMLEVVGSADRAFRRVATETSAHYLLGLEPDKDDRDGKPHDIEVKVARKGVEVRARRQFVMHPETRVARRPRAVAPAAPPSPVRMTPHVMRGASDGQVKVVLAAEVDGFTEGTLAVQVVNPAGTVVGTLSEPLQNANGAPARRQDTLLLARGPYVLKAEAVDRAGKKVTAEKVLNAELLHGVGFDSSDLMLFDGSGEEARLVAGTSVRGRVMPVYLELYVQEVLPTERLGVTIEIVGADGTRRGSAPLALRAGEEPGLHYAEGQVDVWALPPGKYVARAEVTFGTRVARRVERQFEVIR